MRRIRGSLALAARERTRWPALDGIRGMAIAAVVAYHAFKLTGGWTAGKVRSQGVDWWWWPLGSGRLGVDLFFVLSGFLLAFSWGGIRRRHRRLGPALAEFARGRAIRILPPYYLMLAVSIPLLAPELADTARGVWDVLLFLTVQQFNEPKLPQFFNTPLWTLTVEVQFYVLLPVVAFLIARMRPAAPLLAALALSLWWVDHRGVYPTSWLLGRADQFVAGMAVARLVADHLEGRTGAAVRFLRSKATARGLAAAVVVVALYHGSTLGLPRGHRYDQWVHPALGVLLAGVVGHLVVTHGPGLLHRALEATGPRLLGHLSYGIYLWHFPIYDRVLAWTGGRGDGLASTGALAGLLIATAATLTVAVVSYAWIERPFLERKVRSSLSPGPVPSGGSAGTPAVAGR